MSARDQRKRLLSVARQMKNRIALTDEQLLHLTRVLEDVGNGGDANEALGVAHSAGKKESNEIALEERQMIFQWIVCAMLPEPSTDDHESPFGGLGLDLKEAIEAVIGLSEGAWQNPKTKEWHRYFDENGNSKGLFRKYTFESLMNLWTNGKSNHMKVADVHTFDNHSPYPYQ